jgi:regulator of replication initiation timing
MNSSESIGLVMQSSILGKLEIYEKKLSILTSKIKDAFIIYESKFSDEKIKFDLFKEEYKIKFEVIAIENQDLKDRLNNVSKEFEVIAIENQDLKDRLSNVSKEFEVIAIENQELKDRLGISIKEFEVIAIENQDLKDRLGNSVKEFEVIAIENQDLKDRLGNSVKEFELLAIENQDLKDRLSNVSKECEVLVTDRLSYSKTINSTEIVISRPETLNNCVQANNISLVSHFETGSLSSLDELETLTKHHKSAIDSMRLLLKTLSTELNDERALTSKLEAEVNSLKIKIRDSNSLFEEKIKILNLEHDAKCKSFISSDLVLNIKRFVTDVLPTEHKVIEAAEISIKNLTDKINNSNASINFMKNYIKKENVELIRLRMNEIELNRYIDDLKKELKETKEDSMSLLNAKTLEHNSALLALRTLMKTISGELKDDTNNSDNRLSITLKK